MTEQLVDLLLDRLNPEELRWESVTSRNRAVLNAWLSNVVERAWHRVEPIGVRLGQDPEAWHAKR